MISNHCYNIFYIYLFKRHEMNLFKHFYSWLNILLIKKILFHYDTIGHIIFIVIVFV